MDFVRMSHPAVDLPAVATVEAYEQVWQEKGWEVAAEGVDPASPTPPPLPARNASTDEWRAYATDPANDRAIPAANAEQMSRDELASHYTQGA